MVTVGLGRLVRLATLCAVLSALASAGPAAAAAGEACDSCDLDWMRCRRNVQSAQAACGQERAVVCRAKCAAADDGHQPARNQDPVWLATCARTCTGADDVCDDRLRRDAGRCTAIRGLCRRRLSCGG